MANPAHLAKLLEGLEAWNIWRDNNRDIVPNLRFAYLRLANFSGINLKNAILSGASLEEANFSNADFSNADLENAILVATNLNHTKLSDANLSGTKLYRANLSDANLSGAKLYRANLSDANLSGSNLSGAKLNCANIYRINLNRAKLDRASFEYAILKNIKLEEINLSGANLEGFNFSDFNLSGYNLLETNLSDAYLKRVQALGTNFEMAKFTGACIEDWNINSKTNLQNIKCDYIYLKAIYSEEENKWIFTDRIPHDPDKIFAPGEFTKLFQKALETVDLIFSEGIEWSAFLESFQQLQAEIKSDELSIQAIEKKSRGVFIVRVEVPQEADKAEIQKYIEREYEAKLKVIEANYQKQLQAKDETIQIKNEELIKAHQEKATDLLEMARIMSSVQQNTFINNNPKMSTGNTYNQSGNIGIGHMSGGTIAGNAKIAGVINEAAPQDLAQAAVEIQQLLDQLSETYPTKTTSEKMAVGVKLTEEIENNPTRWQKPIKVIKAMGVEALAEAVDNPIFNIAKAGIEAALESM